VDDGPDAIERELLQNMARALAASWNAVRRDVTTSRMYFYPRDMRDGAKGGIKGKRIVVSVEIEEWEENR
jgi:hypothetical protein